MTELMYYQKKARSEQGFRNYVLFPILVFLITGMFIFGKSVNDKLIKNEGWQKEHKSYVDQYFELLILKIETVEDKEKANTQKINDIDKQIDELVIEIYKSHRTRGAEIKN
jgi:hypothetical protein